MHRRHVVVLLVVGWVAGWTTPGWTQTHFDLAGTVTDRSGAVMPGVTATLRNVDTGLVRTSVTDDRGHYNFPTVPPTGSWTLTAELGGFQTVTREGLWGHSFGAYTTSNLITRTDIFAAAVSGATPPELFRNWASGRDRDSRNIETGQARMGGSPFDYPERYLSQSAFFHLDKVKTPVLILHGEKDYTILFAEGEMMFYALRQLGKTAELVAYANGDHSLSRHSRADALDVNRRILEWFDRYLKPSASATFERQD